MDIAILIPTYNRAEIVERTVRLLQENIFYPHHIEIFVGCDGNDDTPDRLSGRRGVKVLPKSTGSLGANLNRLISTAVNSGFDLLMQMDDDHWLNNPIYLEAHARKLVSDSKAGWIRLMHIAGHKYTATLEGSYWRVHWDSPEAYIASNRPHIKHARFHKHYGMYAENLTLGRTEESFSYQCKDRATENSPSVLVPLPEYTEQNWSHVGESWQSKGM